MSKKNWLILAGIGAGVFLYVRNRDSFDGTVRRTAKKIRRELDPIQEQVSDRLENLADTIVNINRKLRIATKIVDAALERIA